MIVDDIDVLRTTAGPAKQDAPLVVDPDTVQAPKITLQSLQPICRRRPEVI
jgi:hypothetical protein